VCANLQQKQQQQQQQQTGNLDCEVAAMHARVAPMLVRKPAAAAAAFADRQLQSLYQRPPCRGQAVFTRLSQPRSSRYSLALNLSKLPQLPACHMHVLRLHLYNSLKLSPVACPQQQVLVAGAAHSKPPQLPTCHMHVLGQ
jgi:hypothetical protein